MTPRREVGPTGGGWRMWGGVSGWRRWAAYIRYANRRETRYARLWGQIRQRPRKTAPQGVWRYQGRQLHRWFVTIVWSDGDDQRGGRGWRMSRRGSTAATARRPSPNTPSGGLTLFSEPVLPDRFRHGLPLCPNHPEVKPCREVKCFPTPPATSSSGPSQGLTWTSPSPSPYCIR